MDKNNLPPLLYTMLSNNLRRNTICIEGYTTRRPVGPTSHCHLHVIAEELDEMVRGRCRDHILTGTYNTLLTTFDWDYEVVEVEDWSEGMEVRWKRRTAHSGRTLHHRAEVVKIFVTDEGLSSQCYAIIKLTIGLNLISPQYVRYRFTVPYEDISEAIRGLDASETDYETDDEWSDDNVEYREEAQEDELLAAGSWSSLVFGCRDTIKETGKTMKDAKAMADSVNQAIDGLRTEVRDVPIWETIVSRMEDFALLYTAIVTSTTLPNVLAAVMQYSKTWINGSVVIKLMEIVRETFAPAMQEQAGESVIEWAEWFSLKWTHAMNGEMRKRISDLLTVVVSTFGSEAAALRINAATLGLVKTRLWDFNRNCVGFVDMALSTITFFLKRGFSAFKSGDITDLLIDETEYDSLDGTCAELLAHARFVKPMMKDSISSAGVFDSYEHFTEKLSKTIGTVVKLLAKTTNATLRSALGTRLRQLRELDVKTIEIAKSAPMRKKPFSLMLHGGSSIGKSFITTLCANAILEASGKPRSQENICYQNDADKYDSEYDQSKHNILVCDDAGWSHPNFVEGNPMNRILRVINNMPIAALKANADEKGDSYWDVTGVIFSTNVKDLQCSTYTREPVAIMRRFDFVVDIELKPEFSGPHGLELPEGQQPDAWNFTVQKVGIQRNDRKKAKDQFFYKTVLKTDSVSEFMTFIGQETKAHCAKQSEVLNSMQCVYTSELCEHYMPRSMCKKCCIIPKLTEDVVPTDGLFEIEESHEDDKWTVSKALSTMFVPVAGISTVIGAIALVRAMTKIHMICESEPQPVVQMKDELPAHYKKVVIQPIPVSRRAATMSVVDFNRRIGMHMLECKLDNGTLDRVCFNLTPLFGNFWLGPAHVMRYFGRTLEYCREDERDCVGIRGTITFSEELCERVPRTDVMVLKIPGGPNSPSFMHHLPKETIRRDAPLVGALVFRPSTRWACEGNVAQQQSMIAQMSAGVFSQSLRIDKIADVTVADNEYTAAHYHFRENCPGLCGAAVVAQSNTNGGAALVGIHTAGSRGHHCCASVVDIVQIQTAIDRLKGDFEPLPEGEFRLEAMGISYGAGISSRDIPPQKAIRWIPKETSASARVFGQHALPDRTFRSEVRPSIISEDVEDVFGQPREHGPPRYLGNWRPWQENLTEIMGTPTGYDNAILKRVTGDMKRTWKRKLKPYHKNIHLISFDDAVNGVPGMRGLDRIDLTTSAGYPLNQAKRHFFREEENGRLVAETIVADEVAYLKETYLRGERAHVIFRANLKDEPTKVSKTAVRLFAGAPVAFLILCKQYFGTLGRVLQNDWLNFNCCIGANAYSGDWSLLAKHLTQFEGASERIFCGDYSKWDKKLNPYILGCAAEILIAALSDAGYDEEDILVLRGILTDIIYPTYEWNGTLMELLASLPSGVFITVLLSNMSNELYFRYTYRVAMPPLLRTQDDTFEKHIVCNFMGDDNIGAVAKECTWWNQKVHSVIMGELGIPYTSFDKKSTIVPFERLQDVRYLKRGFVYKREEDMWIAPLEEASIFKSLHNRMNRRGGVSPEIVAGASIDAAMDEWVRHGRDVYNDRRNKMKELLLRNPAIVNYTVLCREGVPEYDELFLKMMQGSISHAWSLQEEHIEYYIQ